MWRVLSMPLISHWPVWHWRLMLVVLLRHQVSATSGCRLDPSRSSTSSKCPFVSCVHDLHFTKFIFIFYSPLRALKLVNRSANSRLGSSMIALTAYVSAAQWSLWRPTSRQLNDRFDGLRLGSSMIALTAYVSAAQWSLWQPTSRQLNDRFDSLRLGSSMIALTAYASGRASLFSMSFGKCT